jgi:hypothetical protein
MSSSISIQRLSDLGRFDNNNKALLKKMLKQNFVSSLQNSTDKIQYRVLQGSNVLCLPGDWESESDDESDVISRPPERRIEGVTTDDEFFVLAVSSLINDLEHAGEFQTVQGPDEIDSAMKEEAINIINGSTTEVLLTHGSQSLELRKAAGELKGDFDRIDLDSDNYALEPQVWGHHPNGGPLRGANSSLFFMCRFTQPGEYDVKITNTSRLFPTTNRKFILEVKYKIMVTS